LQSGWAAFGFGGCSVPDATGRGALAVRGQSSRSRSRIRLGLHIDARHRLVKTIRTVSNIGDVRGVAAGAATGRLFVAYQDVSGAGMVYCLNVYDDAIAWNKAVSPGVDRLAINPNGQLLYVPTWEGGSADYINVVDASTGEISAGSFLQPIARRPIPSVRADLPGDKADDGIGNYSI
jgi:hypothetical protein